MSVPLTQEEQTFLDVLTTKGRRSTYTGTLSELAERTHSTVSRVKIILYGLERMGLITITKMHVGSVSHHVITVLRTSETQVAKEKAEIARVLEEADRKRESETPPPHAEPETEGMTLEQRVNVLEECSKHLHEDMEVHAERLEVLRAAYQALVLKKMLG